MSFLDGQLSIIRIQAALGSSQKGESLSKAAEGAVATDSALSPEEWAARMPAQLVSACSKQPNREDTDTWLAFLLRPKWNTAALLNGTTSTKKTDRLQIPAEYVVWLDDYLQYENIKTALQRSKVCSFILNFNVTMPVQYVSQQPRLSVTISSVCKCVYNQRQMRTSCQVNSNYEAFENIGRDFSEGQLGRLRITITPLTSSDRRCIVPSAVQRHLSLLYFDTVTRSRLIIAS
jgi:hypothetical protein